MDKKLEEFLNWVFGLLLGAAALGLIYEIWKEITKSSVNWIAVGIFVLILYMIYDLVKG